MIQKPVSPCASCVGVNWPSKGFVPSSGNGENGVLIVAEAQGEEEVYAGAPLMGKAGQYLWQNLKRVGIDREGFKVHGVLSCRPPEGKLFQMAYEQEAIHHCSPLLDSTIHEMKQKVREKGKPLVILTLGKIAFKRIMGIDDRNIIFKYDYQAYPIWNDRYECWVLACNHPSTLMKGSNHLLPILQFTFKRALEIAEDGLVLDSPSYLLNPQPVQFEEWCEGYFRELRDNPSTTFLAYDIETPYKQDGVEDELETESDDFHILQCSFSYKANESVSAKWDAQNMRCFERLFGSSGPMVGWNSQGYDDVRIEAQLPIKGVRYDAMQMWHVLNSALRKGLGFVTPFYVQTTEMWKHLSGSMPAFYNAKDADMTLRNFLGIREDLKRCNLWDVYTRHVVEVHKVFGYMSGQGVLLDTKLRDEAEKKLQFLLDEVEVKMDASVPQEARKLKVFKKTPKMVVCRGCKDSPIAGTIFIKQFIDDGMGSEEMCPSCKGTGLTMPEGMVEVDGLGKTSVCPICKIEGVKANHFKSIGKKKLNTCVVCGGARKKHCDMDEPGLDHPATCALLHHEFKGGMENPCFGSKPLKVEVATRLWAKPLGFKVSKLGLSNYQTALKHQAMLSRKEKKVTFDEKAIIQLVKKYPKDPLYPRVLEHRGLQKLLSVYIGVTQYQEITVDDDYQLQPGEKWGQ